MESKEALKSSRRLSLAIGNFIRYWGFRRIHGAIWTQLYLSHKPMTGTDLSQRLKLSKALISPALSELSAWGLVVEVPSEDGKKKIYTAVENLDDVIKHVLRMREQKIIAAVSSELNFLKNTDTNSIHFDPQRLAKLEDMVLAAQFMLQLFLGSEDLLKLPSHLSIK
ncbi:MAG: MarR family transcriptional regulator [Bdellovibrionaceae bacterium]|nr:MarR family transcriptional regulator [Pseudobdellovibrionaceae bacterium]NUM57039.1 HTH domain-containing protein [Pseudobdellovibrionaceae bacterium]